MILKDDKFCGSLFDYQPPILKIHKLPKTYKPKFPLRPIISGVKQLAK